MAIKQSSDFRRYDKVHESPQGPGDARPTAMQVLKDEDMIGKLQGKTIMVTGASSGLGVETARVLAYTGATIICVARDLKKMESVLNEKILASNPDLDRSRFEVLEMDFNSLESVRKGAAIFLASHTELTVLVMNAGVGGVSQGKTTDGFERHFGVNHLAHFLLFKQLESTLVQSSTPALNSRVVAVSSSIHRFNAVQTEDYNLEKSPYSPAMAYAASKTANIWFANELERRYGKNGVHAISLHPGGITETGLSAHHDPEFVKLMEQVAQDPNLVKIFKTIEQGAAPTVLAAIGRDFEGTGGLYLDDCTVGKEFDPNGPVYGPGFQSHIFDEAGQKKLWTDSLTLVGWKD